MDTLYPGTYSREIKGEPPVTGVATSIAAFAGVTQKGPVGASLLVSSFDEYLAKFGGYLANSYLTYAVKGFFENGGGNAYIARVVHYTNDLKTSAPASVMVGVDPDHAFIAEAISDGAYGNDIQVVTSGYDNVKKTFDIAVRYQSAEVEKFRGVNLTDLENLINGNSQYIQVIVLDDLLSVPNQSFTLAGGIDGADGVVGTDYVKALDALKNADFKVLALPGVTDVAAQVSAEAFAGSKKAGLIKNFLMTASRESIATELSTNGGLVSNRIFPYAGMWGYVSDPIGVGKSPMKVVPLDGHVAGAYARNDNDRGVWKAPAGTALKLKGIVSLFKNFEDGDQTILNPIGVNAIRSLDGEGIVIWGVRTSDANGEYNYISSRRLMDYVQDTILKANRWALFEMNDTPLYEKLTANAEEFLRGIWQAGGLKGATEGEAFFVQCDKNNNPQASVDAGKVNIRIGIADQKPAEFIIHDFSLT